MKLSLVALLAVAALTTTAPADAHELCRDGSAPIVRTPPLAAYATCTAYSDTTDVCLLPSQEGSIPSLAPTQNNACDAILTKAACAAVDAWSAHLFDTETTPNANEMPTLCESFCTSVFNACASAFAARPNAVPAQFRPPQGNTFAQAFPTASAFCSAVGASDPATGGTVYCYAGTPFVLPPPKPFPTQLQICTEKIFGAPDGPVATLAPVPGRPDLIAAASLAGVVRMYRESQAGEWTSQSILIDISSEVRFEGEMGLLGMAFHKSFTTTGRVFLSYSCAGSAGVSCSQGDSIIDEFQVSNPTDANGAFTITSRTTRRRIFKVSQPYSNHNGGQILFSPDPDEPNLFFMLGDGGSGGDPDDRAQPLNKYWGKILRLDVDSTYPSPGFAVPSDNPFVRTPNALGAIWANGLRNPWRCSFDSVLYTFLCGDVGQNAVEEVDIIVKGGNYGWSRFEGNNLFNADRVLRGNTTAIAPILTYTHASVGGAASITGGVVYRSHRDKRLYGVYVFADLYSVFMVAQPNVANGGKTYDTKRVSMVCSQSQSGPSQTCPSRIGNVITFGETGRLDVVFSDYGGTYRIIDPAFCPTKSPTRQPTTRRPTTRRPTRRPTRRRFG